MGLKVYRMLMPLLFSRLGDNKTVALLDELCGQMIGSELFLPNPDQEWLADIYVDDGFLAPCDGGYIVAHGDDRIGTGYVSSTVEQDYTGAVALLCDGKYTAVFPGYPLAYSCALASIMPNFGGNYHALLVPAPDAATELMHYLTLEDFV